MIRFIDIGQQVGGGAWPNPNGSEDIWPREFSFWDTIKDQFFTFSGEQMWVSWNDFRQAWLSHDKPCYDLERFERLCPPWVFDADKKEGVLP